MSTLKYTLITGASCGLGREFAAECARRGRNLLLTALPGENITQFGEQLAREHKIRVVAFEADLTIRDEIINLARQIDKNYQVDMLINNAGLGGAQPFIEASTESIEQIIFLNIYAVVMLTRLLLPNMKRQGEAYILNIASLAAFSPMPYKTVYPASKAFVYSFSRGLNAELSGSGVSVSVAHPGGMKTNTEVSLRIEKHNKLIQATTLSTERVAQICISRLLKRRRIIIPGFFNKLYWLLMKTVPIPVTLSYLRGLFRKEIRHRKRKVQTAPIIPD
jgi:short-subunit dehydrogenase